MLERVVKISQLASVAIMQHYGSTKFSNKPDDSPVTKADLVSDAIISKALRATFDFPILSEEKYIDYQIRRHWKTFWLIDPLDGTKDFLDRNGEFTVNIALVTNGEPVLGVVCCPATGVTYWAEKGKGAFKDGERIYNASSREKLIGTDSRHHSTQQTVEFCSRNGIESIIRHGSSIKMCKVAEGEVDIYPRLNGTKEWDTAASEVILYEAGCELTRYDDHCRLNYNKPDIQNPYFVAYKKGLEWK